MLKEMSVEEQTLYKKWQEMNKGGKMEKVKNKLYNYRTNLWVPSDMDDVELTIKQIEDFWLYFSLIKNYDYLKFYFHSLYFMSHLKH